MLQPGERVSGGQQITHCRCLLLGGGNSPAFQSARARSFVAEVHLDPSGLARSVGGNRKPGHNQNKLIIKSSFSLYEFPDHIAAVKKNVVFILPHYVGSSATVMSSLAFAGACGKRAATPKQMQIQRAAPWLTPGMRLLPP